MKNFEHLRVLYAEDNDDACVMVSMLLGFANIDVTAAQTVAEAWRLAQMEYFDLYLLDSKFPDGSGLELCRQLHDYASHTPILFYSGNAYQADKEKGMAAGASDYLTKPYIGDLAATILQTIKHPEKALAKSCDDSFLESQKKDEVQIFRHIYENQMQTKRI